MNEAGPDTPNISADEALALDYALGILVEPDLGSAKTRLGRDAAFALLVTKYRVRLGSGAIVGGDGRAFVAPRTGTWKAILAKISDQQDS